MHSGGALVQSGEAPAAPAEWLTGRQYKAVGEEGYSPGNCVGLYEFEGGQWNRAVSSAVTL